ncbi:MAG: protein kinase [Phycisphaera sp.]|nr:protein kinase [Phycisphaera sp.]
MGSVYRGGGVTMDSDVKQVVKGIARALIKQGKKPDAVQQVLDLWQKGGGAGLTIDGFGMLLVNSNVTSWSSFRRMVAKATGDKSIPQAPGYEVLEMVSAGASGAVYRARPEGKRQWVAVKMIAKTPETDGVYIRRFVKSGEKAAGFEHPNVATPITAGETDTHLYYVMEFIEGSTVRESLTDVGPYTAEKAVKIILQLADALRAAHEAGIHHPGLKPAEILVTMKGEAKLAELGMARPDGENPDGNPYYMSPEQVKGKPLDHRSDIYSLGATFYHMVTGKVPFAGVRPASVHERIVKMRHKPAIKVKSDVPKTVSDVIDMMLIRDPDKRYQSWDDFITDLQAVADGDPPLLASKGVDLEGLAGLVEPEDERNMTLIVPGMTDEDDDDHVPLWKKPVFWIGAGTALGVVLLIMLFLMF